MKNKAFFTTAGLGVSGGTVAAEAHRSVLIDQAESLKSRAATAVQHYKIIGGTDPAGFYNNVDASADYLRAPEATKTRVSNIKSTSFKAGNVGGGLLTVGGIAYDIAHGKPADRAIVSGGAGFGASVGAGLAAGALIGGPVGATVGAVGGVIVGALTSGAVDSLYENGVGAVRAAIEEGGKAVLDTASAVGSVAKDVGEGIAGGVKDMWSWLTAR